VGCFLNSWIYHGKFSVSRTDIREGGIPTNTKNRVVARSAFGSSFSIHISLLQFNLHKTANLKTHSRQRMSMAEEQECTRSRTQVPQGGSSVGSVLVFKDLRRIEAIKGCLCNCVCREKISLRKREGGKFERPESDDSFCISVKLLKVKFHFSHLMFLNVKSIPYSSCC